jgi:hypothetical protein
MNPAPPSASKGRLIGGIVLSLLYSSWLVLLLATLLDSSASFQTIRRPLLIFLIAFVPLGLAMFSSLAREAFWASVYFIFMVFLGDFAAELLGGLMALMGRYRLHPIGIVTVAIAIVVIVQARKFRAIRAPAMVGTLAGLFAFPLFQLLFAVGKVWADFNSPYLGPDDPLSSMVLVVRLFAGLMLIVFLWPRRDASPSSGLPVDANETQGISASDQPTDRTGRAREGLPERRRQFRFCQGRQLVRIRWKERTATRSTNSRSAIAGKRWMLTRA